jgi:hypothetical protein
MHKGLAVQELNKEALSKITNKSHVELLHNTQAISINKYDNNQMQDLVKYLLKICKFIGINEPPDIEILQMLGQFIKDYWGYFTLKEINASIYYGINDNELDHYGKLTPQLLNKLFTNYKNKRGKAIFVYRQELDRLT